MVRHLVPFQLTISTPVVPLTAPKYHCPPRTLEWHCSISTCVPSTCELPGSVTQYARLLCHLIYTGPGGGPACAFGAAMVSNPSVSMIEIPMMIFLIINPLFQKCVMPDGTIITLHS